MEQEKYTNIYFSLALFQLNGTSHFKIACICGMWDVAGNTKGGSIIVPLTSCLTGLEQSVLQVKTKIVSSHTADSKPVKQEVGGTVILPPLVFPGCGMRSIFQVQIMKMVILLLVIHSSKKIKVSFILFSTLKIVDPPPILNPCLILFADKIKSICCFSNPRHGKYCKMLFIRIIHLLLISQSVHC